jgi:hypothetical protein
MFLRLLVVTCILVTCFISLIAQDGNRQEKARLSDAFGEFNEESVRSKLDTFFFEISQEPGSRGLVILYGSTDELIFRKTLVANHIRFRKQDPSRFRYQLGGKVTQPRTELWVVPSGAEDPDLNRIAWVGMELRRTVGSRAKRLIRDFFSLSRIDRNIGFYVINYGSDSEIAGRERLIANNIGRLPEFPEPRITLVRGGNVRKFSTVMWVVPRGAKNPAP